jgi:hypothetical protein
MFIRRIPAFARKSIVSAVALTSAALLHPVDPAAARVILSACQIKHSQCTERCIMNNKGFDKQQACISRTCDKQNPGCGPSSLSTGSKQLATSPPGPKPTVGRGPFSATSTGLLDAAPGLGGQAPAATGSPVRPAAPSAPPVIIR